MNVYLFGIILEIILLIVLILIRNIFVDIPTYVMIFSLIVITYISFTLPEMCIDAYGKYDDESIYSYTLLKNDYVSLQSGEFSGVMISYIDSNNKICKKDVTNCEIRYYYDEPKIEFVKVRLGFIYNTTHIIYLNKE